MDDGSRRAPVHERLPDMDLQPGADRNGKLRGTDHIPGFLRKKYAFDRYGDYHFVPYGHQKGRATAFPTAISARGGQFRLVASLDEKPGYTILRYDSGKALLTLERDCAGWSIPAAALPCSTCFLPRAARPRVFDGWFQAMGIKSPNRKEAGRLFQLVQPLSEHHRGYHPGGPDRLPQPALPGRPVPDR